MHSSISPAVKQVTVLNSDK